MIIMLVSHKYRFLFVHIAKTGGTSVRSALTRHLWTDPVRYVQLMCSRVSGWSGHRLGIKFPRHAKAVAAQEMLPGDYFASLFKFTFVRNPWDLQVSSYHHVRRERPHLVEHITDFDQFLHYKFVAERPYHYILDASVEAQWYWTVNVQGEPLLDSIGRYERLQEDFWRICERIGLSQKMTLPHKRKTSSGEDYRSYYSDQGAELVAQRYAPDIQHFGYTFDP